MNAYADRLAVDVVTAPLAEIDRRTLSEAWYCALNLARTTAPSQSSNRNVRQTGREPVRVDRSVGPAHATTMSVIANPSQRHAGSPPTTQLERRRPPGSLARKIERALARPQVPTRRVTLTLQGRSDRVELLVRSSGRCDPRDRRLRSGRTRPGSAGLDARTVCFGAPRHRTPSTRARTRTMTVDAAMGAAFDRLASRERDAMRAFTPGATPENTDVAGAQRIALTLDPLSVVPREGDYFVVGNRHGGRSYARDGSLALRDGELVDQTGRAVFDGWALVCGGVVASFR